MLNLFIAVNGDDVGRRIGQAIVSDDHASLQSASEAINSGHGMIEKWVESVGGRVLTSSGDEGIYEIPQAASAELEGIRQQYQQLSQHTLTIGVGTSMSEASKALIYGKLNAKDQVVQYEPGIEQHLSPESPEESMEEEAPMMEEGAPEEAPMEEEVPMEEGLEGEGLEEEIEAPVNEFDGEHGEEVGMEEEAPPVHEQDMPLEEEVVHDAAENQEDEQDIDNIEADEELGEEGSDGIDYEGDDSDGAGSEMEDGQESHSEMLENMVSGHMEEDSEEIPMGEEDPMSPEGEMGEEVPMEGEEEMSPEMGEEMPMEEESMEEGGDLRGEIAEVLMKFKQNKHLLEQARDASPELYDANLSMIRLMIDMAKQLGMAPEMGMEEEMPMEEAPMEEGMPVEESSEEAPIMEEEEGESEEKKQEGKSDK